MAVAVENVQVIAFRLLFTVTRASNGYKSMPWLQTAFQAEEHEAECST